jgi:hypothetical protein
MPSYTLGNWDGGLSTQDQTSSQRQENQASSSATVYSRPAPNTPQKVEKPLANGSLTGNKYRNQAGGGENSGLMVCIFFQPAISPVTYQVLI